MSEPSPTASILDRECIAFSYYLIEQQPEDYVLQKYREAHDNSDFNSAGKTFAFDRFLSALAVIHPLFTRFVDSYTSVFFRSSTVCRKWTLLLAILESTGPTYSFFDNPDPGSKQWLLLRMAAKTSVSLMILIVATLILGPLHLVSRAFSKLSA
jgi:hypothetical protein